MNQHRRLHQRSLESVYVLTVPRFLTPAVSLRPLRARLMIKRVLPLTIMLNHKLAYTRLHIPTIRNKASSCMIRRTMEISIRLELATLKVSS
jgi:hypothetical protein